MIVNWDLILNDLSVRLKDGTPDFKNEQHIIKLWDVFKEHKWPVEARVELIKSLTITEDWWSDMTTSQQNQYIKDHPKSQKAIDAKKEKENFPEGLQKILIVIQGHVKMLTLSFYLWTYKRLEI